MTQLFYNDRGREEYSRTLELQQRLVTRVIDSETERAYLLLVEHDPPVFTLGRAADRDHVLASPQAIATENIQVHATTRGGDVTYHGPGQLVAYPILRIDLHCEGVREYLRKLEDVVIGVLSEFAIDGRRVPDYTGVWVGEEKIAAIGVAVRRWVSYHGVALNVQPNMNHFGMIVPCGIRDKKVTSLAQLLGNSISVSQVKPVLIKWMVNVFGFESARQDSLEPL